MLRAWRGRRLRRPRLVGVLQLLLALQRLVERLHQQSGARSGVPPSSAGVHDQCLDDDLVKSCHRERQQKLHAEVLVVWCRRLHHLVARILLTTHQPSSVHCSYYSTTAVDFRQTLPPALKHWHTVLSASAGTFSLTVQ